MTTSLSALNVPPSGLNVGVATVALAARTGKLPASRAAEAKPMARRIGLVLVFMWILQVGPETGEAVAVSSKSQGGRFCIELTQAGWAG